jgi:hypothetical protein
MAMLAAIAAVTLVATSQTASAQYVTGRSDSPFGPTTSPYLNLLQNNNQFNAVSTYNTLVKPIIDQGSAIQRQGSGLNRLQRQVNSGFANMAAPQAAAPQGRGGYFMYYSHFYSQRR